MERMAIDSLFCFVAETKSRRETIFKQLEDIDRSTKIAKKSGRPRMALTRKF